VRLLLKRGLRLSASDYLHLLFCRMFGYHALFALGHGEEVQLARDGSVKMRKGIIRVKTVSTFTQENYPEGEEK